MPKPDTNRSTHGRLINRAIGDDAEKEISKLLSIRFSDPEDPGLQARREALVREFVKFPLDRASSLLSRLLHPRPGDGVAQGFRRLSHPVQKELKRILEKRAATYRAIVDPVQAQRAVQRYRATDPRYRPDYIDNLEDAVGFNGVLLTVSIYWHDKGDRHVVRIPARQVALQQVRSFAHDQRIYDSKDRAQNAVEILRTQWGNDVEAVFGYYIGPYGVILPTLFCNESTPRISKLLPEVMHDYYGEMTRAYNILANVVDPVPLTSVDARGRLHLKLDFTSVAFALLAIFHLKEGSSALQRGESTGGEVRVNVTPKEAEAIRELQQTFSKGKRWTDLPRTTRALLGNLFHKTVESLSEFIYRGVGEVHRRVAITPEFLAEQKRRGGRVLFVESSIRVKGGTGNIDLAEVDFGAKKVVVIDLTSVDRATHVAKTRGYAASLARLTGFPTTALEFRYIGDEGHLLRTLTEALVSHPEP